jgi:hypothetical protein
MGGLLQGSGEGLVLSREESVATLSLSVGGRLLMPMIVGPFGLELGMYGSWLATPVAFTVGGLGTVHQPDRIGGHVVVGVRLDL